MTASDVGSCVVVRRDGKALGAMWMRGLRIYTAKKIEECISQWKEDIVAEVTKEN